MINFFRKSKGILALTFLMIVETSSGQSFKKKSLSVEIISSILPKAKITRNEGSYMLQSRLQSAYDFGINYVYNFSRNLLISSGFHIILGKRNFYANIPSEDLIRYNLSGQLLIEDKAIWKSIRIPVIVEKKIWPKR